VAVGLGDFKKKKWGKLGVKVIFSLWDWLDSNRFWDEYCVCSRDGFGLWSHSQPGSRLP